MFDFLLALLPVWIVAFLSGVIYFDISSGVALSFGLVLVLVLSVAALASSLVDLVGGA